MTVRFVVKAIHMPFNVSIVLTTYREALTAKSTESLATTCPDCHNARVFLRSLRVKVSLEMNQAAFFPCRV